MNSVRIMIEWGFGKVVNTFRIHSFTPVQKPHLSRIAVWYLVSVLLVNCQVCMYGSQAAAYFECKPPSLEEYLREASIDDPAWKEAYDKYRPLIYPMRLPKEDRTKWNTGQKEWEYMQRLGVEVVGEVDSDEEDEQWK